MRTAYYGPQGIRFLFYFFKELTSKQSHEGKLKIEGNGGTYKPCDQMKGQKTNEQKQRIKERTNKITPARTHKPDNRTAKCQPNKRKMD